MPDELNESGLQIATADEIREQLVDGYQEIYGPDINLDSNTSDGQLIDLMTQMQIDFREMLMDVYNTLSPNLCRGKLQDIRYQLNNVWRKGGSFSIVPMTLTITKTVKLEGLDGNYNDPLAVAYGFADNGGNKWYLIDTVELTPGQYVLPFRAEKKGPETPTIGTITNPLTLKLEVSKGINDSAPTSIGIEEEDDEAYALRREKAIENRALNSVDALRGQLLALEGVTEAYVYNHDYDNYPDSVDSDSIPLHYIWVIVEGGSADEIGQAIYANTGGCGTIGDIMVGTPTASGQTYVCHFDRTKAIPLYIKFDLQETSPLQVFDYDLIKEYIAENLTFETNEFAETSKVTEIIRQAIQSVGGAGVGVNVELSIDNKKWLDYIPSTSKQNKFTVDTSRIEITEVNLDV